MANFRVCVNADVAWFGTDSDEALSKARELKRELPKSLVYVSQYVETLEWGEWYNQYIHGDDWPSALRVYGEKK